MIVSPANPALSRPWIDGRRSKNVCAYASAAKPITRSTASTAPRPRNIAVRRIFCPIGDQVAWIRARGRWPPLVVILAGMLLDMFEGAEILRFPPPPTGLGRRGVRGAAGHPPGEQSRPGEPPHL